MKVSSAKNWRDQWDYHRLSLRRVKLLLLLLLLLLRNQPQRHRCVLPTMMILWTKQKRRPRRIMCSLWFYIISRLCCDRWYHFCGTIFRCLIRCGAGYTIGSHTGKDERRTNHHSCLRCHPDLALQLGVTETTPLWITATIVFGTDRYILTDIFTIITRGWYPYSPSIIFVLIYNLWFLYGILVIASFQRKNRPEMNLK